MTSITNEDNSLIKSFEKTSASVFKLCAARYDDLSKIQTAAHKVFSKEIADPSPLCRYQFIYACEVLAIKKEAITSAFSVIESLFHVGRYKKAKSFLNFSPEEKYTWALSYLAAGDNEMVQSLLEGEELNGSSENFLQLIALDQLNTLWSTYKDTYSHLNIHFRRMLDIFIMRSEAREVSSEFIWMHLFKLINRQATISDSLFKEAFENGALLVWLPYECAQVIRRAPRDLAREFTNSLYDSLPHSLLYKYLYHSIRDSSELKKEDIEYAFSLLDYTKEPGTAVLTAALISTLNSRSERVVHYKRLLGKCEFETFNAQMTFNLFRFMKNDFNEKDLYNSFLKLSERYPHSVPLLMLKSFDLDAASLKTIQDTESIETLTFLYTSTNEISDAKDEIAEKILAIAPKNNDILVRYLYSLDRHPPEVVLEKLDKLHIDSESVSRIWDSLKVHPQFQEIILKIPYTDKFKPLIKHRMSIPGISTFKADVEFLSKDINNIEIRTIHAKELIFQKKWREALSLFPQADFSAYLFLWNAMEEPDFPPFEEVFDAWKKPFTQEERETLWNVIVDHGCFLKIPRSAITLPFIRRRAIDPGLPTYLEDIKFLAIHQTEVVARTALAKYYIQIGVRKNAYDLFPHVEMDDELLQFALSYLQERNKWDEILSYIQYEDKYFVKKCLVSAFLNKGRGEEALLRIKKLMEREGETAELLKLKVKAFIVLKRWSAAEDIVEAELKKNPANKIYKKFQEEILTCKKQVKVEPVLPPPLPEPARTPLAAPKKEFVSKLIEEVPKSKREKYPERFTAPINSDQNATRAFFDAKSSKAVDPLKPAFDLTQIKKMAAQAERQAKKEEKREVQTNQKPKAAAKPIIKVDLTPFQKLTIRHAGEKLLEFEKLPAEANPKIALNRAIYTLLRCLIPISFGVKDASLKELLTKYRNQARRIPSQVKLEKAQALLDYFKERKVSQQLIGWVDGSTVLTSLVLTPFPLIEGKEKDLTEAELLKVIVDELHFLHEAKGVKEDLEKNLSLFNAMKASLSIIGKASVNLSDETKRKIDHYLKPFREHGKKTAHFYDNTTESDDAFEEISPPELWELAAKAASIIQKINQ